MNIFFLDENPRLAAQYHCDKHLNKMILEGAQFICNAFHAFDLEPPYRKTHFNHPCSVWVRESWQNVCWLFDLMYQLNEERKERFGITKNHRSFEVIDELLTKYCFEISSIMKNDKLTKFPKVVAQDLKEKIENPVECYREYYRRDKKHLHKWTKRNKPWWIDS